MIKAFAISIIFFGFVTGSTTGRALTTTDTLIVEVKGTGSDARFEPAVIKIDMGNIIQFIVREGIHTVTAYHPDNRRSLRMPKQATSFDSGLLRPGDSWNLEIKKEGVYDFFCLPHERMGHVGRIIAGNITSMPDYPTKRIPRIVIKKLTTETENFLTNTTDKYK